MPGVEENVDQDLAEGCRQGRIEAFERLYGLEGPRMKSLAANLLGNPADAEDAVQETFLKIYRGARDFKGGAALSTWAFRILLNTCYDALRRRRRRPEDPASDGLESRPGTSSDHPLRLALEKAVAGLPERERVAFLLVEVEGFSHREAGEVLEVPEATSRTLLFAARNRLKSVLAPARRHGVTDGPVDRGRLEEEISDAARSLKKSWSSPDLWPRIHRALSLEAGRRESAGQRVGFFEDLLGSLHSNWRPALAAIVLFGLATAGLFVFRGSGGRDPYTAGAGTRPPLMTEQAAEEVDRAEVAYIASIQKLSALAASRLETATAPVLVNYREKLALIDGAIAELKANIDQNRFNTHLREELLAMYKEKQRTLQDVLEEVKS